MPHKVFLSYSHTDKRLAVALENALERVARPKQRADRIDVFRDETKFKLDRPLPRVIEEALSNSQWLVLVASPDSAKSEWVQREIDEYLAHHPPSSVLLVLAQGELHWSDDLVAFTGDPPLPRQLKDAYRQVPLWTNFAWRRRHTRLSLSNGRFLVEVTKLAGTIRDRNPGDLARVQKRRLRLRAAVAAAAVVVLVAAGISSTAIRRIFETPQPLCAAPPKPANARPPYNDGALVTISDAADHAGSPFAVEQLGDALLRYRKPQEALLLGRTASGSLPYESYVADHQGHRVPSGPQLFRERVGPDNRPGRMYLDEAGVVYPISSPEAVREVHLDPADALIVPYHAFEHEDFEPRSGVLLQISGSRDVWKVDGSAERRRITDCRPRDVVALPNSPGILTRIPRSSADRQNTAPLDPPPARRVPPNVSPVLTVTLCSWDHDRQQASVAALLQNTSHTSARYSVKVRMISERGVQAAATPDWKSVGVVEPGKMRPYRKSWTGDSSMRSAACRFFIDAEPVERDASGAQAP